MRLVLQTANVVSDAKNCLYPNRVEARDAAELQEAIKKDHVCGEYKKNYRSKENFIRSNVAVMDCDNDHRPFHTLTTVHPQPLSAPHPSAFPMRQTQTESIADP